VSGGTPLEKRAGLRRAVDLVEAREVEVAVVAYFDRLFRSLGVQSAHQGRATRAAPEPGGRSCARPPRRTPRACRRLQRRPLASDAPDGILRRPNVGRVLGLR
jgi:hypothetical protein